jgi:hypothetical protein
MSPRIGTLSSVTVMRSSTSPPITTVFWSGTITVVFSARLESVGPVTGSTDSSAVISVSMSIDT